MDGIGAGFKKSAKSAAAAAAKQIAQEPLEILKEAPEQILGIPVSEAPKQEPKKTPEENAQEQEQKAREKEFFQAYKNELNAIRQNSLEEEKARAAAEAQMQPEENVPAPLIEPSSKKPRGIMAGMGGKVKKTMGTVMNKVRRREAGKSPTG